MSPKTAQKTGLSPALPDVFKGTFGKTPTLLARAPGRVNLLGEHVDYNDGIVLPAAIDREVHLAAVPREDEIVEIFAADLQRRGQHPLVCFRLAQLEQKTDLHGKPLPRWAYYPAGVAWALRQEGLEVRGVQVSFTSNVPIGAGLSSSAAVEVGFGVIWQALGGWQIPPLRLAQLCQRAENQYVGVSCGLMDQFASACGVADHALYFDTRSLEYMPAPLPQGAAIVIADSGVRRNLANVGYNDRRRACEQAVAMLRQYLPEIHALRDVSTTEFAAYSMFLPPEVSKRAEHVVKEIHRVQTALSALRRNDKQAFGAMMFSCHNSLKTLYEVSTPELDTLVELARNLPGIIGARLTGAGFGGCTVNLVEADQAQSFIRNLQDGYLHATGRKTQVYLCRAVNGAGVV